MCFFSLQWPCSWIYLIATLQNQRTVPQFHHIYIKIINPTKFWICKTKLKAKFWNFISHMSFKSEHWWTHTKNKPISLQIKKKFKQRQHFDPKKKKTDPSKFIGSISDLQSILDTNTYMGSEITGDGRAWCYMWESRWDDWRISRVCKVLKEGMIYRVMCSTRTHNLRIVLRPFEYSLDYLCLPDPTLMVVWIRGLFNGVGLRDG